MIIALLVQTYTIVSINRPTLFSAINEENDDEFVGKSFDLLNNVKQLHVHVLVTVGLHENNVISSKLIYKIFLLRAF